jgi:hypothetical protein
MKNYLIILLCLLNIATFAQNFTIQNNTQSVTILPNAIQTNRPELTGYGNLSIGKEALRLAGVGQMSNINAIAIGDSALSNALFGTYDVIAIGVNAAKNTSSKRELIGPGGLNIAIGNNAFLENISGIGNLAIGHMALKKGSNYYNMAIGHNTLQNLNFGNNNVSIGSNTMSQLINGNDNVTVGGMQHLQSGYQNTAIGNNAMGGVNAGGNYNTSIGNQALYTNAGSNNAAVGNEALSRNSSGNFNTAIGGHALSENLYGASNVAIGTFSLMNNQVGERNVTVGKNAGYYNNGSDNIFLGNDAGMYVTGSNKLYIANRANAFPVIYGDLVSGQIGLSTETPANKFVIYQTSSSLPNYAQWTNNNSGQTDNDGLEIGIQSSLDAYIWQNENNPLSLGTNNTERLRINANGLIGVGRTATTNIFEVQGEASKTTAGNWIGNSDKRLKKNIAYISSHEALQKVLQMKGAYYEWNDKATGIKRPNGIQFGFIAQDLQQIFPAKVKTDNLGYLQTAYGDYDPMFAEAIKALNEKIERLEKENISLKTLNNDLLVIKNELTELKAIIHNKVSTNNTK